MYAYLIHQINVNMNKINDALNATNVGKYHKGFTQNLSIGIKYLI